MTKSILAASLLAAITTTAALAEDVQSLSAEGAGLIKQFGGTLKAELQAAIKSGGPANGISVCNSRAPAIALSVSEQSGGWTIARSSHRLRNPNNAPDAYTAAIIEDFLARAEAGEPVADLARAEITDQDGQRVFRMTKAIPTAQVCVTCHGDTVPPEVEAALTMYYPDDAARGFSEGDMRGVFTLLKPLD